MRTAVLVELLVADDIGRDGRTWWELHALTRDREDIDAAVAELVRDGLVDDANGIVGLTPAGLRFIEAELDPEAPPLRPSAGQPGPPRPSARPEA